MDGTKNFVLPSDDPVSADWCVLVGLVVDGTPVAGVEVTFTKGNSVGCPFSRQLSISFVCDPVYRAIARDQAVTEETTCASARSP